MKKLIAQLAAQVEKHNADQAAALLAAETPGISAEDRAKHLAEFDRIQVEKAKANDTLKRATELDRDQAAVALPSRLPIAEPAYNPAAPVANRVTIPARARRHGQLVAFKGRDEDAFLAGLWYAATMCVHATDMEYGQALRARAREHGMDFVSDPNRGTPNASLAGLSNQTGGYFVPEIIETTIIEITQQYGDIRRLAEVVGMTSDTKTTPRWSGAMVAYWIGRGVAPTSSDPKWNAIQLTARDMGAMTKIAKQIDEDSLIDLGEKVTVNIGRAFSYAEDNAAFNGDGTSTYGGINGILTRLAESANANCIVTATGHTTVPTLTNADFLKLTGQYPNYAMARPAWICHKQFWSQSMAALQLAGGGNTVNEVAGGGRKEFLGYPVEFVNVMPAAPTTGQIGCVFGDLSLGVKVGDRRGKTVQAGYENDDFTKQLITILGTQRVDVNVHTVVDPLGDTKVTGGPIMCLKLG